MVKRRQSNGNVTVNAVIVISPRHRLPGLYGYRVARHDEAKAGGLFDRIGNFVVRWPLIVIGCWIAVAAALTLLLPTLQAQAAKREQAPLPPGAPSMVLQKEMSAAFQEKIETSALLLVLLTNENGLGPADEAVYRKLIENLRADTQDKISVQDFLAVPEMKELLASKDNKAWNLPITFAGDAASPETQAAFKRVAAIVKQTVAGTSLTVHLSGPIATVADLTELGEKDVRIIEIGTAVSVLIILILVYRNLVTMLVPLATIGASVVTAQGTLSGLAEFGLAVNMQAIVFMSAVMIGAGTDYAVFLISRYHDYVRHGEKSDMAVKKALMSIGKVITASAATVAVTFLAMVFTKLEVFSAVGPAIAVAITVSLLGAVTLLPAILTLTGRRGWIKPRRDLTSRRGQLERDSQHPAGHDGPDGRRQDHPTTGKCVPICRAHAGSGGQSERDRQPMPNKSPLGPALWSTPSTPARCVTAIPPVGRRAHSWRRLSRRRTTACSGPSER